jgi:hypothetical protein
MVFHIDLDIVQLSLVSFVEFGRMECVFCYIPTYVYSIVVFTYVSDLYEDGERRRAQTSIGNFTSSFFFFFFH